VRASKFRHVFGQAAKKTECYDSLRITKNSLENYYIAINAKYIALCIDAGGGGAFVVIPHEKYGRQEVTAPKVCAHEQDVLDLAWSPFNDQIIASSSEDGTIKIWEIPEGGLLTNLTSPLLTFDYHQRRCSNIQWHPVASNVLMSVSQDPSIVVWNLEDGSAVCEIDCHPDIVFNAEFSRNGDKIVTVCKDKKIRIIDARTGAVLAEGPGHEGAKPQRVTFLKHDRLFVTGFSRMSERQYGVWDQKDLSKPLATVQLDSANGTLVPFHDWDTSVVYLCGRGDSVIRYFEHVEEDPYVHYLSVFQTNESARSLNWMPKHALNANICEVARFFKVHAKGLVEPISFTVPRKSDLFQDDLYPDTPGTEPALTAEQWVSGQSSEPILMSMKQAFKEKEKPKIKGLGSKGLGKGGLGASKGLGSKTAAKSETKPAAASSDSSAKPSVETGKSSHEPAAAAPQRSSAASSVDNSVVKMLQEQVKKLQGEMASLKAELSSVKETAKKNGERVTVLESLVQEETDDEDDKK